MWEYVQSTAMRRETSSASQCVGCGKCEKHCPQGIPIRTMLKEAGMAVYPGGEEALRVLNKLVSYKEYLDDRKSVTSEVRAREACEA